jgi:neutral trehalase
VAVAADESFVASALSVLEMEHAFWMTEGERAVRLYDTPTADGKASKPHTLNRYWTQADYPRPESFKEDLHHAGMAVRLGVAAASPACSL